MVSDDLRERAVGDKHAVKSNGAANGCKAHHTRTGTARFLHGHRLCRSRPAGGAVVNGGSSQNGVCRGGLALGDTVERDNPSYRAYHCGPSEQFAGFTWCTKTSTPRTSRGLVYSSSSILHSADGTIVYANKTLEPAFSSSADAQEQIQQIAQKYGAQPRIIEMPHRPGFPDGVIAVWGDVVLQPVDPNSVSQLAVGKSPQLGFMIDFIADFQRSARNGLPIYRIDGGAGSVWAASYGQPDRGTLRFVAVDASRFASPPDQTLRVAQSSPPPDQTAIVAQPPLAPDQTAQPFTPPTDKENES